MHFKESRFYEFLFGWAEALLIKANFRWVSIRTLQGDSSPPKWWQNLLLALLTALSPRYKHT